MASDHQQFGGVCHAPRRRHHQGAPPRESRLCHRDAAAAPGKITTVTAPSGFSIALVEYVNLQQGYAEARPEVMLGAAGGDRPGGLCPHQPVASSVERGFSNERFRVALFFVIRPLTP